MTSAFRLLVGTGFWLVGTFDLFGTAASSLLPLRMTSVPSFSVTDSLGYSPFPGALVRRIATARSGPGEWACEPAVAVHPTNPAQAVVGTVLSRIHRTGSLGAQWESQTVQSPFGVYGDPVLAYGPEGRLYFFHLSDSEGKGWKGEGLLDRMVVQWSDDNGETWSSGVGIGYRPPKDQDKEWVCIDPRTGNLHLTWTEFDVYGSKKATHRSRILYAKSTDRGATWSSPTVLSLLEGDCRDDDGTTEGAVPALDARGRLHVVWSRDGKLWYNRSDDAGGTWLDKEHLVAAQPGGWTFSIPSLGRANGLPFTVCRGEEEVFTLFGTQQNDFARLWIVVSRDQGEHWQTPVEFRPEPGCQNAFFGALSVDPTTQHLHAISYAQDSELKIRTYYSRSTDGGRTWTHLPLQASGFTTQPEVFFGDYNHLEVKNGQVYAVWTEQHNGVNSVWCLSLNEVALFGENPPRHP